MMAAEVGKVRAAEQGELLQAVFGHASLRTAKVGLQGVPEHKALRLRRHVLPTGLAEAADQLLQVQCLLQGLLHQGLLR